ncbi:reverse transcriptase [Ancylostoma caninum]|uniref:Reverse transcriptase n=1 Tax=Ancylostoma caninum TaxID=29170 RepID=A0A368FLS7_ANCCA|nr:reverse transcriptase [Ancylostoma caninum]
MRETEFVDGEIESLLRTGAIEQVQCKPDVVSPLSVAIGKKRRLILDLSWFNSFVVKESIKYEDMTKAIDILSNADFLATFDFKSGYHHISIHPGYQKFFGFSWRERFYVFKVLPFGFTSAPFIFTKVFKPLLARWRKWGINMCLYLDDGLVCGKSGHEVSRAIEVIKEDLNRAGVTLALDKCYLEPSPVGQWLGFEIDLRAKKSSVSKDRVRKAVRQLEGLRSLRCPSLRERCRCMGTINSMWLVIGQESMLHLRAINNKIIHANAPLDWHVRKDEDEEHEIEYWINRMKEGLGAVIAMGEFRDSTAANIPPSMQGESSAFREMLAAKLAIQTWQHLLRNKKAELRTDNQSVATILDKGSSKPALHRICYEILHILSRNKIRLAVKWVPREHNLEADLANRRLDFDDWGINHMVANALQARWGAPLLDLFATPHNKKAPLFIGKEWSGDDNQIARDALAPDNIPLWTRGLLWIVPPPNMIHAVLHRLEQAKGRGIVGMPYWPSHNAFSALKELGRNWIYQVRDGVLFPTGTKLFTLPSIPAQAFRSEFASFPFLFALVDFSDNPTTRRQIHFQ